MKKLLWSLLSRSTKPKKSSSSPSASSPSFSAPATPAPQVPSATPKKSEKPAPAQTSASKANAAEPKAKPDSAQKSPEKYSPQRAPKPGRGRPRPSEDASLELNSASLPKASAVKKAKLVKAREYAEETAPGRRRPVPRAPKPQRATPTTTRPKHPNAPTAPRSSEPTTTSAQAAAKKSVKTDNASHLEKNNQEKKPQEKKPQEKNLPEKPPQGKKDPAKKPATANDHAAQPPQAAASAVAGAAAATAAAQTSNTTQPVEAAQPVKAAQPAKAASESEISRALARRSQSVGTPNEKQLKTSKPSREQRRAADKPHTTQAASTTPAEKKPAAPHPTDGQGVVNEQARAGAATVPDKAHSDKPHEEHHTDVLAVPKESAKVKKERRARLRQVPGLDGLRGLAVLAVVIYHFFGDILPGGYLGVDMFFVLSGFLITSLLVREFNVTGRINLKDFWIRRFRRILPAALVVLCVCTAIVAAIGGDLAVGIREQFLGTLFFVNNWVQIATSQTYFAPNEVQVFAHYWSLAVEEQFYVIWPLLMALVFVLSRRKPKRLPIAVSLILTVASALAMALLFVPSEDPTRVYYGTDTHAFGLLIGALLSFLLTSTKKDPRADSWASSGKGIIAGIVGFLALVAYVAQLFLMGADLDFTYRGGLVLTSVLGAAMIWGVVRERGPLTWIFRTGVMRWLGQRSFSLYLWHWPLIMILLAVVDAPSWVLGLIALPVSFLLAEITYQFVENPFRRGGYLKTWRDYKAARPSLHEMKQGFGKVMWPLVPVLIVLSLVGVVYAVATSSDKTELERELERMSETNKQAGVALPDDSPEAPEETETSSAKPTEKPPLPTGENITAIGDSVMLAASEALNEQFPGIYIDAAVSRHYSAAVPALQALNDSGQLRDTVFIGLGTNGAAFEGQMDEILDLIGPERTVVLALPYGDRDWMYPARAELVEAAKARDNVYIADWCGAALENPDLLYDDDIHPLPEGANLYAQSFQDALEQYADGDKNLSTACQL